MRATLSELHRETAKIVRPVMHGDKEVILTDRGEPRAKIVPLGPVPARFRTKAEALAAIEASPLAFECSWDELRKLTR